MCSSRRDTRHGHSDVSARAPLHVSDVGAPSAVGALFLHFLATAGSDQSLPSTCMSIRPQTKVRDSEAYCLRTVMAKNTWVTTQNLEIQDVAPNLLSSVSQAAGGGVLIDTPTHCSAVCCSGGAAEVSYRVDRFYRAALACRTHQQGPMRRCGVVRNPKAGAITAHECADGSA